MKNAFLSNIILQHHIHLHFILVSSWIFQACLEMMAFIFCLLTLCMVVGTVEFFSELNSIESTEFTKFVENYFWLF